MVVPNKGDRVTTIQHGPGGIPRHEFVSFVSAVFNGLMFSQYSSRWPHDHGKISCQWSNVLPIIFPVNSIYSQIAFYTKYFVLTFSRDVVSTLSNQRTYRWFSTRQQEILLSCTKPLVWRKPTSAKPLQSLIQCHNCCDVQYLNDSGGLLTQHHLTVSLLSNTD